MLYERFFPTKFLITASKFNSEFFIRDWKLALAVTTDFSFSPYRPSKKAQARGTTPPFLHSPACFKLTFLNNYKIFINIKNIHLFDITSTLFLINSWRICIILKTMISLLICKWLFLFMVNFSETRPPSIFINIWH